MSTDAIYVRRRTWTWEEKRRIVDEAFSGEASISSVALRYGLQPHQLYRWRDSLAAEQAEAVSSDFVAVEVTPQIAVLPSPLPALLDCDGGRAAKPGSSSDFVEIGLPGGLTVRVPASRGAAFVADVALSLSRGSS
jgi:transposase